MVRIKDFQSYHIVEEDDCYILNIYRYQVVIEFIHEEWYFVPELEDKIIFSKKERDIKNLDETLVFYNTEGITTRFTLGKLRDVTDLKDRIEIVILEFEQRKRNSSCIYNHRPYIPARAYGTKDIGQRGQLEIVTRFELLNVEREIDNSLIENNKDKFLELVKIKTQLEKRLHKVKFFK